MKKLLLVSTAIAGLAFMSAPASAAVKLDLGGFFRGYGVWSDNDETGAGDTERSFDLRRDTEVHVSGETTLDNGLTVGFHTEQDLGGATQTDEAYAYFSGGWGRLNVGSEDGAAYLLQVGGPSADSNVDGLRTYIEAIAPQDAVFTFTTNGLGLSQSDTLDYDHVSDATGAANSDRLTYLSPKFNGFQAGVSYAPEAGQNAVGNNVAVPVQDDDNGDYQDIWEAGVRWDGEFQGVGVSLGGGYSNADLENHSTGITADATPVVSDDLSTWNAGLNLSWNGFSFGGSYLRANTENTDGLDPNGAAPLRDVSMDVDQTTWVVGLGWDNGPYHLGASYLRTDVERDSNGGVAADDGELAALDADISRFTVGGGYTFGPGMTFRGAVAWGEYDNSTSATVDAGQTGQFAGAAATNNDFQQITVGTDIQF